MTVLAESLDNYIEKEEVGEIPQQTGFVIDDDRKADWAIRKIASYQQKIEEVQQLAEERNKLVERWLVGETAEAQRQIEFFERLLQPYVEGRLAGGKTKTLKLPSGSAQLQKAAVQFLSAGKKVDRKDAKLLEWARQSAPEHIKVEETVDWSNVKKTLIPEENGRVLTADGEVLEFMSAWRPPDGIKVTPAKLPQEGESDE